MTPEQRIADLEAQVAVWRDCFEEITAKATPYGVDDPIKCYIIPAGPLYRAAGKTRCQAFDMDANLREALAEHHRVMIEEVIPAIEADEKERALAAIELRFPRRAGRRQK